MSVITIKKKGRLTATENAARLKMKQIIDQLPKEKQNDYYNRVYNPLDLDDTIHKLERELLHYQMETMPPEPKTEPTIEQTKAPMTEVEDAQVISETTNTKTTQPFSVPNKFDPLVESVISRSYNATKSAQEIGDIPEPTFNNNIEFDTDNIADENIAGAGVSEEPKQKPLDNIRNEAMNDLSDKEKNFATKQMVQTVLDGYAMLHVVAQKFTQYPEDKLGKLIQTGKLDPNLQIPVSPTETATPIELIQEYNNSVAEVLTYDPEFGESVRPAMEREFAKRGWGLTDLQYIGIQFAKDAGFKALQVFGLKKSINSTVDQMVQATMQMRAGAMPTEPIAPDSVTYNEPQPAQHKSPRAEHDDAVIEFEMSQPAGASTEAEELEKKLENA